MEERILEVNLAILNPMEKIVYFFEMQIGRYDRATLTIKIEDSTVQDSSLSKQKTK